MNPEPFAAPVLRMEDGMAFHYIPVPRDVARQIVTAGSRRVLATINGVVVDRAIQGGKEEDPYIVLGLAILRSVNAALGDVVIVELAPHPDPSAVELGEELEAVLAMDEEAAARFFAMTPGRQRGYAYYVTSAKRVETRIKRALDLAHKLRTHTLYGDLNPPDQDQNW